jgi:hypothetical protein
MRVLHGVLAAASLTWCIVAPFLYFLGRITMDAYKTQLFLASIAWFVLATVWAATRSAGRRSD